MGSELHVVVRGANYGQIWHGYVNLNTNVFSGWTLLDGATPSAPTLTANSTHLYLVVRGNDDRIYFRYYALASHIWSGWTAVSSGTTADTPAAALMNNRLELVVRGSNGNQIWHGSLYLASNTIYSWNLLDGATPSPPVLAAIPAHGTMCLVVRGNDNAIYYRWFSQFVVPGWSVWELLPAGTTLDAPAATITEESYLHIVVRGTNYDLLWHGKLTISPKAWSGWTLLSGSTPSKPVLTN